MRLVSRSEEDTVKQGELYSAGLKAGDIIGLDGNLGTGKTQFVKASRRDSVSGNREQSDIYDCE